LEVQTVFGTDGTPEFPYEWFLDGEKQTDVSWADLSGECDFHFPHYYNGPRSEDHWREAENEEVMDRLQDTLDRLWFGQTGEQPTQ
jgi:hypothetical protein